MSQDIDAKAQAELVERLDSHMGQADMGEVLRDCRLARDVITTLTAERDALRKTNREFHRRVQKSEAVNQSAMAVLQGWIDYFVATVPTGGKKRQERLLFYWAIRDAKKQADKRIAALSRSEV